MTSTTPLPGKSGDRPVSFTSAFVAVFLAGVVTGAIESQLPLARFGPATGLFLTTFTSILICAVAIEIGLVMMDATAPLAVIILSTAVGTVISLVLTHVENAALLPAQTNVARESPVLLPVAGLGLNAVGLLTWFAIAAGQAFVIQSVAAE